MSDNSETSSLKRAAQGPVFYPNYKIPKQISDENDSSNKQDDSIWIPQKVLEQKPNWSNRRNVRYFKNYDNYQIPQQQLNPEPSTPASTTYKDRFADLSGLKLPAELKELFKCLVCELCGMKFTSNVMARIHYESKNHKKKVKRYLVEHSTELPTCVTSPVVTLIQQSSVTAEDDPKYFFCEVCTLPFTSRIHAESHYMGKNHQRSVAKQRAFGVPQHDVIRDGFKMPTSDNVTKESKLLQCKLCNVHVTCSVQLESHLKGQKHRKKLKMQEDVNQISQIIGVIPSQSTINIDTDFSIYRTPGGCYYCKVCDLSVNSESQFKQHLISKKHTKKINGINK